MILDDIADFLEDLHKKESAKTISRHFGKERKWFYIHRYGFSYVLDSTFIAGLNHYGYELKLVKKERQKCNT